MITVVLLLSALIFGYASAVALLMAFTFGIGSWAPAFVVKEYRITTRYKLTEELAWLVCASAGGYIAAAVAGRTLLWGLGAVLAAMMIVALWSNTWEMRHRGIAHQVLMSVASIAGVTVGCLLQLR